MLIRFFLALKAAGLPVSVREFLALLGALAAGVARPTLEEFHALARTCLVKDESRFDLYDRVFARYLEGIDTALGPDAAAIPQDWLHAQAELVLSDEEKAKLAALGSWDELMRTLAERLREQRGRHQGGSKWIGTAGTSPYGNSGYNPEGVRIGGTGRNRSAVKVWERRDYRDLDDSLEIGTRNIALALRKLRRFAREGAADELDLEGTVHGTARNAGLLDLKFRPERHNAVKVLLFLDIGGSMDEHVRQCEELFSAARAEFKHLEHFYFHNCVYERVWRDNARRYEQWTATADLMHKYPADYRAIFVGDASMSPHEILREGGSIEHWNEESGATWMKRLTELYTRAVWLNPVPEHTWGYTPSIGVLRELMGDRMYPMTIEGLGRAIERLKRA
ncbi:MAG TPA: VWA domain-containing protein [Xanthomonadales bacterium]|nr:VWA domain-containing protein [Xanthomonadales bacterium]